MEARESIREISPNLDDLRESVFTYAKNGEVAPLRLALKQRKKEEVAYVLNTPTVYGKSLETPPLIIAARKGHTTVVCELLSKYGVDVEQTGMVEFSGHPIIKGASALWCAASIGNLDMVKLLVEQFAAQVNHATITNSTPLRPACFDGFLDVVEYLIAKGAEVNRPTNYYSNTCLLIAAYNGHRDVVRFLLQSGARHDLRDFMGQTALHNAAEKGHLDIAKDLIEHGASFLADHKHLTPLHVACDFNHVDMVNYFLTLDEFTGLDKIHALELLGASYANGSEDYNIEKAYRYMHEAMVLRYVDQDMPIMKEVLPAEDVYKNQIESTTLDQLQKIEHDEDHINTEALIIKERILGKFNVHILDIVYRGAVLADRRDYSGCIHLWNRALEIKKHNKESLANDLERYGELFSEMLEENVPVDVLDMVRVLKECVEEIRMDQGRLETRTHDPEIARLHGNMKQVLHTVILLVSAILDIPDPVNSHHTTKMLIYQLVKLKPTLKLHKNATCLHIVCDSTVEMNEYFIQSLVSCPNAKVAAILLECGSDPNVMDSQGNTPLHVLCKTIMEISQAERDTKAEAWVQMCGKLLENGAHIDFKNTDGKLPMEYTEDPQQREAFNKRSLKCLAAAAVHSNQIPCDILPLSLINFVKNH